MSIEKEVILGDGVEIRKYGKEAMLIYRLNSENFKILILNPKLLFLGQGKHKMIIRMDF